MYLSLISEFIMIFFLSGTSIIDRTNLLIAKLKPLNRALSRKQQKQQFKKF